MVTGLQVFICFLFSVALKNHIQTIALVLCNIAFYFYSCFGIITYDLEDEYYFSYLSCVIVFNLFFFAGDYFAGKICHEQIIDNSRFRSKSDYILHETFGYLKVITILYLIIRIGWLFYPEMNIKYLFVRPNFIYENTLVAANVSVSNPIGKVFSTFTTITLPFVLIYLSKYNKRKWIVYFLLFDLLASYLMGRASIGRLTIIRSILVICMYFYLTEISHIKRRKYIYIFSIGIVISFIVYYLLENWRNGNMVSVFDLGIIDSIKHFVDSELFYPKHYPLAKLLHEQGVYSPKTFWLWLVTLPIPKTIINLSSVNPYTSIIYRVFTYYYWGGHWGDATNYAGMLLSVLGDGIMVYGTTLAFIIVIPFALFIGFFLKYLRTIHGAEAFYCYALFYFVVSFRPGVQYALQYVNTFVGMLAIILLFKIAHNTIRPIKITWK